MLGLNSCGDAPQKNEEPEKIEELVGVPFTRFTKQDTCLFITHKIEEYDLWKAAFDLAEGVREKNGITTLNVYQDLLDPHMSMVLTNVDDIKKAKDYITSADLEKSMAAAGVSGGMDLYWVRKRMEFTKPITDTILMFMSFSVVSYDRWENAFLQDYRDEPERDFQVLTVMQGVEDEGQVVMIYAVNDPEYVSKMEQNNSFRMKMLAAGVISYPVTYKLRPMPI